MTRQESHDEAPAGEGTGERAGRSGQGSSSLVTHLAQLHKRSRLEALVKGHEKSAERDPDGTAPD